MAATKNMTVYWLVQQITNLAYRAREVRRLSAEHGLNAAERKALAERLADLDSRRSAKAAKKAKAASQPWLKEPATAKQIEAIHRMRQAFASDKKLTKGQARSEMMRLRAAHSKIAALDREGSEEMECDEVIGEALLLEAEALKRDLGRPAILRDDDTPLEDDVEQLEIKGYSLTRTGDSVDIVAPDGEVVTKELTGQRHWANFQAKFRRDAEYRESYFA